MRERETKVDLTKKHNNTCNNLVPKLTNSFLFTSPS